MPGWHNACRVSPQLGRMEGEINVEEEKKIRNLKRADRQCPTNYGMTSSHQSPGNEEVTGARAVGGGSVENVTEKGETAEKLLATDLTLVTHILKG